MRPGVPGLLAQNAKLGFLGECDKASDEFRYVSESAVHEVDRMRVGLVG